MLHDANTVHSQANSFLAQVLIRGEVSVFFVAPVRSSPHSHTSFVPFSRLLSATALPQPEALSHYHPPLNISSSIPHLVRA